MNPYRQSAVLRWEYTTLISVPDTDLMGGGLVNEEALRGQLNELGAEGWELASSFPTTYGRGATRRIVLVFKRPRPDML